MIAITEHADGCILPVRAQPGARRNAVVGEHGGALKIAVTAPAQDGRANKAVVALLCEVLNLKRAQLALQSGQTARDKRFLITGVSQQQLEERVARLIAE